MGIETYPIKVAEIYDKIMGYFNYKKSAALIDNIIKEDNKIKILEIGIGTGSLALELIKLGYEVEGIDHSPAMLTKAKEKGLSSQILHLCDAKNFNLKKKFSI